MCRKRNWCVLFLLLFVYALLLNGEKVSAAAKYHVYNETLWVGNMSSVSSPYGDFPNDVKITSVKSSKPKIVKIQKDKNAIRINNYRMLPLKTGKATITVKFQVGNKKYTASGVMTVKKYPNPFQYIKLNGEKINLKKNQYSYHLHDYIKNKATISVKLKKGWTFNLWEKIDFASNKYTYPKTLNGKSFKIGSDGTHVGFSIVNSKGDSLYYYIVIYPMPN